MLIPAALAWTLIIATFRVYRRQGGSVPVYLVAGGIIVVLMLLAWSWGRAAQRKTAAAQALDEAEIIEPDGERVFPVPPMDLPHYHGVGLAEEGGPSEAGTGGSLADSTTVTISLTTSPACCTFPAMAAKGIGFAYENAVRQSSLQLDAMASLDTKVAVIIAALLVGTGFLFHPSQPTWVRVVIAVLLAAALITSSLALVLGAKRRVAPSPEKVGEFFDTVAAEGLESLFLPNVIAAFNKDFTRYKWKARCYNLSLSIVAVGVIFIGSVRLAGVF